VQVCPAIIANGLLFYRAGGGMVDFDKGNLRRLGVQSPGENIKARAQVDHLLIAISDGLPGGFFKESFADHIVLTDPRHQ
jgi:hypothetical protein